MWDTRGTKKRRDSGTLGTANKKAAREQKFPGSLKDTFPLNGPKLKVVLGAGIEPARP